MKAPNKFSIVTRLVYAERTVVAHALGGKRENISSTRFTTAIRKTALFVEFLLVMAIGLLSSEAFGAIQSGSITVTLGPLVSKTSTPLSEIYEATVNWSFNYQSQLSSGNSGMIEYSILTGAYNPPTSPVAALAGDRATNGWARPNEGLVTYLQDTNNYLTNTSIDGKVSATGVQILTKSGSYKVRLNKYGSLPIDNHSTVRQCDYLYLVITGFDLNYALRTSEPLGSSLVESAKIIWPGTQLPGVSVTVSPSSVIENGIPNLDFTFTRPEPTTSALTVNFTASGTALRTGTGVDYVATGAASFNTTSGVGTVTIPAGSLTKTVTVNPTGDATPEPDDTVIFTVNSGPGYTVGSPSSATGTIINDDTTVTVAVTAPVLEDALLSYLTYTFTRSGATTSNLTVNFTVGGSATQTTGLVPDYTVEGADTFNGTSGTLTIYDGYDTAEITVATIKDSTVETNETVVFTVTSGTGYNVGTPSSASGVIENDDALISMRVSQAVMENGVPNLVFTFTRTTYTASTLTVSFAVSGDAEYGGQYSDYNVLGAGDYGTIGGKVTFSYGASTALVTVDPIPDTRVELDETVTLTLLDGEGYEKGSPFNATGFIWNDDTGPPTVSFNSSASSVPETVGTVNVMVTLSATTSTVTVPFSVSGTSTAIPGSDYAIASSPLTFAPGETVKSIPVTVIDDTFAEPSKTVIITLGTPTTNATLGSPSTHTLTITDSDTTPLLPTVSVAVSPASVTEDGTTNLVYTFTRTGSAASAITANFSVSGSAIFTTNATTDYTQTGAATFNTTAGTVTIAAGGTTATATVTVNPATESTVEANETAILTVTSGTGYTVGSPSSVTGTIANDDVGPEIVVSWNSINISDDDVTPSTTDGTDFGSVAVTGGTVTRTFTITNSGTAALNLISPVPPYYVELMTPSGFSVTTQATTPVASGGGTTTFSITFDPSSIGINTAIVSFMYDDETPFSSTFNFSIQGTGVLSSNANLSNLVVNTAPLSPSFASSTTSYTASVSYSTTSVTVTPTVADTTASVKVNNVAVTSGSASGALALAVGSNTITTLVTAQDGSTRAYTVTVTRAAPPAPEIAVSGNTANIADGSAQPSPGDHTDFGNVVVTGGTLTRTFMIQNIGTAGLTLGTVTVSGTHAADFSVTSAPASSVAAGDSTTFQVTFDPSDYSSRVATLSFINNDGDENPFSFSIQGAGVQSSNADLSNLVVNTGAIAPAFVSGITAYTVGVPNATSAIIVTPTVADSNASVRVNGTAVTSGSASGPVSLNSTGPNVITILVTAPDGSTKNYTLNASPVLAWGSTGLVPAGLSGVTAIAAGYSKTVALKNDGTVVAWGYSGNGQTTVPAGLSGVSAIAAGGYYTGHTVALKSNGTVVAWGDDGYGLATVPAGLSGVIAIAAGYYHTVALKNDGKVVAWGDDRYGQATVPSGLDGVIAIAAGGYHTVALKNNGTVVAWGNNDSYGQTTTVPSGLNGVIAIAAGQLHTVALKNDGTVVAWGNNDGGQTTVPSGLSGVTAIAAGSLHTVALKNDGTVVAWGYNYNGQMTVPAGLSGVSAIAAGAWHTVALMGAAPDIAVEQTAGAGLVDGASSVDFGTVNTGSTGAVLSFTIKNMGSAPLTRLAVTKDGAQAAEYVVTSPLVRVLAPGARTTFTVKFAPLAAGPRSALIHIGSNDMDENSFDIALTGTGVARPAITTQPVGPLLVGTGEGAGFTVASDSAVTPVYKWLKNGLFITGGTSAQFNISNAKLTDAGAYSAALTNAAGSATSSAARLGVVSLATTDVTVNEAATLTLTVSKSIPAGAVVGYQWKKNGGELANGGVSPAQVLSGATGTTLSITKAAAANAGSYSCVVGMDGLTKESGVFNVSVRLKPVVNAAGPFIWFTGDLVTEQIVAVNNPTTFVFTGLPAGVTGNTVTGKLSGRPTAATISAKTFTVTASNLAGTSPPMVVSYTVASLPAYGAGSYNGLVKASTTEPDRAPLLSNGSGEDGTTADVSTEGFFTSKVESSGAFSGKLTIDGLVLSVTGIFDHNGVARFGTNGAASVTVSHPDKLALTLTLNLDLTAPPGNNGKLRGTVTQKLVSVVQALSNIDADRAHYSTTNKVPVNLAGTATKPYTLVFPSKTQSPVKDLNTYPQGDGFATMTVNVNGTVSLTGKLADDTVITASTPLSKLNLWPIFAQLYTLKGSIAGMAALTDANSTTEDVIGTNLQWFRPTQNVQWYNNGWPAGITVDVNGARYVVPPALPLASVFPLTTATDTDGNAALSFTGGLLSPLPLPYSINISTANLATNAPVAASPTMLVDKASGKITGTFTHTDGPTIKPAYQGVIIQKGSKKGGWGYFMSRATPLTYFGESGRVQVQAK